MTQRRLSEYHQDQLREVAEVIARELRKAGYEGNDLAGIERIAIVSLLARAALNEVTRYRPSVIEIVEAERPE